ncbi:PH domain-containing protein [Microbacterium sp. HJ5]
MPEPVTFRPRGSQILAWAAIGVCALGLVFIAVTEGVPALLLWSWPIVLVAWLAWIVYVRPYVRVNEAFIEVGNVFRTHRVPWSDVADVDSRYALTVTTTGGRSIRAWAAPAPSARQAMSTRREEVAAVPGDGDFRRPADAEGTPSGDAAAIVRRTLLQYRRSGAGDAVGGTVSMLNVAVIAVTAVLLAAAVLSLALPHG